ncbi:MAG: hypothetical protein MZV49_07420 [Rhodopseudomonas palustris]|nr:hypothetical protein [Rhodopseudomonas palustris]
MTRCAGRSGAVARRDRRAATSGAPIFGRRDRIEPIVEQRGVDRVQWRHRARCCMCRSTSPLETA